MKFYVAMFVILGVVLLLIPTANMGLSGERTDSSSGSPQAQEEQQAPENPPQEAKESSAKALSPKVPPEEQAAAQAQLKQKEKQKQEDIQKKLEEKLEKESFHILNQTTGKVDSIAVKDYVRGAVSAEMPPTFHMEALKAQAVSAHTYALNMQREAEKAGRNYDFSADPANWKGYVTEEQAKERFGTYFEEYWGKLTTAADSVYTKIMMYDEEPIAAAYHAISGGKTEAAVEVWGNPVEYLTPVDSIGDLRAPGFEETVILTNEEVQKAFGIAFPKIKLEGKPENWFTIDTRSESGYVTKMTASGTDITGLEFREALGLRSSNMTIDCTGEQFTIITKGYGHGVGLSQYGADYLARQGADYEDILKHYYPGAQLKDRV